MKRLVYSPSVNVYVKTDSGVVDLSDYVTSCSVTRKMHTLSDARIDFRNPKVGDGGFMFTDNTVFHPMDPIIISMTRLKNRPVQVFTGYCDSTPYFQMFPGIATITATCTLKRLLHTYWDPGLPFVVDFMIKHGWAYNPNTGESRMANTINAENTNQLNDTGVGNLLANFLNEVGGWEPSDIIIDPLPSQAIQNQVGKIFEDLQKGSKKDIEKYNAFLSDFVKTTSELARARTTSSQDTNTAAPTLLDSTWSKVISEYSNQGITEIMVNTTLSQNYRAAGYISGDKQKVEIAAKNAKIPFSVLWGVYGTASAYGKTTNWFGNGEGQQFEDAAKSAAESIAGLYKEINRKDPDY